MRILPAHAVHVAALGPNFERLLILISETIIKINGFALTARP
jgi:hypothetical protein